MCTAVVVGVAGGGHRYGDEEVWFHLQLPGEAERECFDAWEAYALKNKTKQKIEFKTEFDLLNLLSLCLDAKISLLSSSFS